MKEIRFRLHTENKIVGYEIWNFFDSRWECFDILGNKIKDVPFHTGKDQFIGFKDNNGKEIYEGDIVDNGHKFTPHKGVVEFWDASFRVNCRTGSGLYNLALTGAMCNGKVEVIGNIYETPELLEDKND